MIRQFNADWTAPARPASYKTGNLVYLFPGIETSTVIAQPVLQLGNSGFYNPGNNWIGALYICRSSTDPCYHGSSTISILGQDQLSGLVFLNNCASGKCDVTVWITNNTTQQQVSMTLRAAVPSTGETNDAYTYAIAGALEVQNIDFCTELPVGPVTFSNLALFDETGNREFLTYDGAPDPTVSPQCSYGVTGGTSSTTLFMNNP